MDGDCIHTHPFPLLRDEANYVVHARVPPEEGEPPEWEQLWTRKIDDTSVSLCCVPAFLYDMALSDVLEIDSSNKVVRVLKPSGRFVFRAFFVDRTPDFLLLVEKEIVEARAQIEPIHHNLWAIDAPDEPWAQTISGILLQHENEGRLHYETGKL